MSEIERTKELIEQLESAEEILLGSIDGLFLCPIGKAKKQIVGVERNCQIRKLDPSFLTENPYYKNIYVDEWQIGNVYLTTKDYYKEYETLLYAARRRDKKTLLPIYEYCYFPQDMHYPSLGVINIDSKGKCSSSKWMGVEPSEINTFASFIEEAKGKVLLMGCGLGYLAYMLSLKDDVDEITIVELNPFIKRMFEMYLKPQMNSKINIIQGDAIQFLERENLSSYQYCSVDIWHDDKDMYPIYLKCLFLEQRHPNTKFHYWLEEDLHTGLEGVWIMLLNKFIDKEYKDANLEMFTGVLNMQNLETPEDIRAFLTTPKRPLIKEWVLKHPEEAINPKTLNRTMLDIQRNYK